MIIGTGNDLIDISRIEKTLARHGERFIRRIFTPIEIAKSERRQQRRLPTPSGSPPRKPAPKRSERG